jgi:hypothetical protein
VGKLDVVLWVAENQSGFAITDHFAGPGMGAGDDWQAARHSFENGQIESVFQRRTNIEIGSGIKEQDVRGRLFEVDPALQGRLHEDFLDAFLFAIRASGLNRTVSTALGMTVTSSRWKYDFSCAATREDTATRRTPGSG